MARIKLSLSLEDLDELSDYIEVKLQLMDELNEIKTPVNDYYTKKIQVEFDENHKLIKKII